MTAVLTADGITHSYGATVALDHVDLRVEAGEFVALLGPNGAGKTTLVRSAIGLVRPDVGRIEVAGGDPLAATTRRRLGVVQQEAGFPAGLTVWDIVSGAAARAGADRAAAPAALAEMGLEGLERRRAARLSGGQQQRLQLAMGLVADPALLILDEPTVGLDVRSRQQFWQSIRRRRDQGTGVLLTTHIVDEAGAVADRVVVINAGRIVTSGTPAELRRTLPNRHIKARTGIDERWLAAIPGVTAAVREGDEVTVTAIDAEETVRWMLSQDPNLTQLTVSTASLDDVLMTLTDPKEVAA